ncbi:MAG: alanine--glyoxylate aminotransferase family protein [Candidatus Latescibacterota bacterium]|nr:MAG: alanine--glyoxylate aminotransferase family protein [Candidatus Latescibacterota bacterium]
MARRRLFTPGPTEVPWQVREKMSRPLIHHRTDEYRKIQGETIEGLQWLMRTKNPVLLLTCSGTGAMEASLVNLTRPGDQVLVTVVGKFSNRWKEIAEAYGLDVVAVEARWGDPVSPRDVAAALDANPDVKIVFTTHAETSTGVLQDVKTMTQLAHKHGALIVVDAITSLCAEEVETDAWGLDVVIGGAQKGVMIPPGLAFLTVSDAAREGMERAGHPVYYFDLVRALKSYEQGDTPWTPGIASVVGLHESLAMLKAEGLENVKARHAANARATRAAVQALGLELLASAPANCTTPVVFGEGRADTVRKHLNDVYGLRVAGGQAQLKGKIVRIGHLGHYFEADMLMLMSAFESTLKDLGMVDSVGRGVEAMFGEYHQK